MNAKDLTNSDLQNQDTESDSDSDSSDDKFSFIEEESESEPEIECDFWDKDCRVVDKKLEENPITGFIVLSLDHLMPTCSREPNEYPTKKLKLSVEIRENLLSKQFCNDFKLAWNQNNKFNGNKVELIVDPFKVCIINNFLDNERLLDGVREEFNELDWNTRRVDLYEFFQSKDLKYLDNFPVISTIHKFLEDDVMKWISNLTGFNLTHVSDICSFYSNTDYLLVHDDQRGDRMVAFVLYLTGKNGWDRSKGGALQLLAKDDNGDPSTVVRDIYPVNNQLVFFPVTNDSYHQVAEITSLGDCRLSINGWFHTKIAPVFTSPVYNIPSGGLFGIQKILPKKVDAELKSWLTEDYLNNKNIIAIQEYFEENSEICLKNFFKKNCLDEILLTLQNPDLKWNKTGPPNRYCYEIIENNSLPDFLNRFLSIFASKELFSLLQKYTSLKLQSMKYELQRWIPGSYSLLTDYYYNWHEKKELDLIIMFGCKNNSNVIGGRTQYVTIGEEIQSALLTLEPEENNLNIIYRDTARVTSYYSQQSKCQCFYMLVCSYSE